MGGKGGPDKGMAEDDAKSDVPAVQRKTSIVNWVSIIRPRVPSEEKYHWVIISHYGSFLAVWSASLMRLPVLTPWDHLMHLVTIKISCRTPSEFAYSTYIYIWCAFVLV